MKCLYLGIEQAAAGNRIHDISRAVFEHAKRYGYGVVRDFCGHGVGYSQHEEPQIPNYVNRGNNPRIKAGMILAIEPMINAGVDDVRVMPDGWTVKTADGSLSAHWEHTVAVFGDHTEFLTSDDSPLFANPVGEMVQAAIYQLLFRDSGEEIMQE